MPRLLAALVLALLAAALGGRAARAQTTPPAPPPTGTAAPAPTLQPGPGQDVATIKADSVVASVEGGVPVQRLFSTAGGIVAVQQGATTVTASQATVTGTPGSRSVVLTGAVRLTNGADVVEASAMRYEEASRTGAASGGVRVANGADVVETEALRYDARSQRADTDAPLRLTAADGAVLTAARGSYFSREKRADVAGNVRLDDGTTTLTAASGRYFTETRRADFAGQVQLVDAETRLTAERGTYDRGTRQATFDGNVRLVDSTSVLTARRGAYDRDAERATFEGDMLLVDEETRLSAQRGTYDRARRFATFDGNVQLVDSTSTLTARQGTYDRARRFATFDGNVQLRDSTSTLTAERGTYDRTTERADFAGDVRLVRRRAARPDADRAPTAVREVVTGETLTYYRREERSSAEGAFRLERDDLDATGAVRTRTILTGGRIDNDERVGTTYAVRLATGPEPLLVRVAYPPPDSADARPDTLALRAARLFLRRTDAAPAAEGRPATTATQDVRAAGHVRLWTRAYAADADSAYAFRDGPSGAERDSLRLFGPPRPAAPAADSTRGTPTTGPDSTRPPAGTAVEAQVTTEGPRRDASLPPPLPPPTPAPPTAPPVSTRSATRDTAAAPTGPRRPVGFVRRAQVHADTLEVVAVGGEARRLHALGAAFVAEEDSLTGRFNQARGGRLDGTFLDGDRRRFVLGPSAELLFFRTTDGRPDGALRASGDRAVLDAVGETIRRGEVLSDVEGQYVPEDARTAALRLDGFLWQPERRPTFEALVRGVLLPSLARPAPDGRR